MSSLYTPFSTEGSDSREILHVNTFDVKTIKKHKQTNASCMIRYSCLLHNLYPHIVATKHN